MGGTRLGEGRTWLNLTFMGGTMSTSTDELIKGLNEDLQGEFQAVIMYRLYASMVQGPYRQELRTFFANEIPEELMHAQILADKISILVVHPPRLPNRSKL